MTSRGKITQVNLFEWNSRVSLEFSPMFDSDSGGWIERNKVWLGNVASDNSSIELQVQVVLVLQGNIGNCQHVDNCPVGLKLKAFLFQLVRILAAWRGCFPVPLKQKAPLQMLQDPLFQGFLWEDSLGKD